MTNILRKILPNHEQVMTLHLQIENKPFLKRYLGDTPSPLTLLDHYRHLTQLKVVYDTFAELIATSGLAFPKELQALLQRGEHIQHDLEFLSPYVSTESRDIILETTTNYANHLRQIPRENNHELLIHFLISILGDLNGGQFLKNCVRRLYRESNIYSESQPDAGVSFYSFERRTAANLTAWLKTIIPFHEDETIEMPTHEHSQQLAQGAVDAFTMQAAIVDELEQTRFSKQPSVTKNNASFFQSNPWIVPAATVAAATVVVGIMTAIR